MKSTYWCFVTIAFLSLNVWSQASKKMFTQNQVRNDLDYLYQAVLETHFNPYAFCTAEQFKAAYQKVKSKVKTDSISQLQTVKLFQTLISELNNGHTELDFPGNIYAEYVYNSGSIFPLELALENGKCFVRKNFSKNDTIVAGAELLRINGKEINEIIEEMYPFVSAERLYLKHTKIEALSFPRYYWLVYGQQDDFNVELKINNKVQRFQLQSVSALDDFEMKREEILNSKRILKCNAELAYLNPGSFGGDEPEFKRFIDSSFTEIKQQKTKTLIIDLRNNSGGNDSFSDYLVSYIADKPFNWNSGFYLKSSKLLKQHIRKNKDTTSLFNSAILNHKDGETFTYAFPGYQPQTKEKQFKGRVYVLINRQSHSQASVTAAQIQDYGFGIIVGEETGDYPSLFASQFNFTLPDTGIPVKVSKGYIIRVNGSEHKTGVMPDIFIKDQLLDDNDEILDGLLELISENTAH